VNILWHRPSMCQKRPSMCQKRPSMCQKRPSMCQKRPSMCQKRPSMCQKSLLSEYTMAWTLEDLFVNVEYTLVSEFT